MHFIKSHIQVFLDRIARKRAREEIRQGLLCEYINPRSGKLCSSYKTNNSQFCHCHARENPNGDNHIFTKKKIDEYEEEEYEDTTQIDFDNLLNTLLLFLIFKFYVFSFYVWWAIIRVFIISIRCMHCSFPF